MSQEDGGESAWPAGTAGTCNRMFDVLCLLCRASLKRLQRCVLCRGVSFLRRTAVDLAAWRWFHATPERLPRW